MSRTSDNTAAGRPGVWILSLIGRFKVMLIVIALLALSIALYRLNNSRSVPVETTQDLRMPVTNPPLEPDRPDLIGEPRINQESPEKTPE
jgi:hypothetical protein